LSGCTRRSGLNVPSYTLCRSTNLRVDLPLLLFVLSILPATVAAQHRTIGLDISAQAIAVHTRVDPVPGGTSLDEVRVVQPVLLVRAHALGGKLGFLGSLNFEGWTMPEGELTPGAFGEGYVDRRHPHTYFHELMLSVTDPLGSIDGNLRVSLSGGKGFAAFGTDDPMSRPVLRYPANHHFSQILERAVVVAGIAYGPLLVEGSWFNGDEPETPEQWPLLDRFGDSRSFRITAAPVHGLELQYSAAEVHSPEHRPGAGLEVIRKSAAVRWEDAISGMPAYLLLEWAETAEGDRFFVFDSYLLELEARPGRHRAYYRLERTERPEEQRTLSRFRTQRPHLENSLIGITNWNIHSLGYGFTFGPWIRDFRVEPFAEVSYATVSRVGGGLFRPDQYYGGTEFWAVSLGLRLDWRMRGHRMGRYGVAAHPMSAAQH
jgi:hypothetical protein